MIVIQCRDTDLPFFGLPSVRLYLALLGWFEAILCVSFSPGESKSTIVICVGIHRSLRAAHPSGRRPLCLAGRSTVSIRSRSLFFTPRFSCTMLRSVLYPQFVYSLPAVIVCFQMFNVQLCTFCFYTSYVLHFVSARTACNSVHLSSTESPHPLAACA